MPLAALLLLACGAEPAQAQAQAAVSMPDPGSRLLFGLGLHMGAGVDQVGQFASPLSAGIGIYARAGYGLNDHWGFEAAVSMATALLSDYLRETLTGDLTPSDWFTFAFGPVLREGVNFFAFSYGDTNTPNFITRTDSLAGTVRADFHLGASRTKRERGRSALTLGVVGEFGATVDTDLGPANGLAYGAYLTLGYAHY